MFGGHDDAQAAPGTVPASAQDDQPSGAPPAPPSADASAPPPAVSTDHSGGFLASPSLTPPTEDTSSSTESALSAPAMSTDIPDNLTEIKQQALQQLAPMVDHLDQTPEDKFRTYMMMIQASDNKDLIKDAYAAAEQITDEKTKAQALLDVVNEINYFTQQAQGGDQPEPATS